MTFPDRTIYWFPMSRDTGRLLAALMGACLVFHAGAGAQDPASPPGGSLHTFFTARSAVIDGSLPADLAKEFEKGEGAPLKSVSIDLDGDGRAEKFVLGGSPSLSGGSEWLIFDPVRNVSRGVIIGAIVFIEREAENGYPALETYWKQGRDMAVVFRYAYSRGRYGRVASRSLTVQEISDYFRSKPPLDQELELVEIKGPE